MKRGETMLDQRQESALCRSVTRLRKLMIDTDVAFMDCYFEERGGRWKMPEADSEVPSFISTSLLIGYPDRSVTSLSLSLSAGLLQAEAT